MNVLIDQHSPLAFAVLLGGQEVTGARLLIPIAKRAKPSLHLVLGDKAYRRRPGAALGVELDGEAPPLP